MSTMESVKAQIRTLIDNANTVTGNTDTDLTTAIGSLIEKANSGGSGEQPQLNAPTISKSGDTLTITNASANGGFVKNYNIYDGETLFATQSIETLDMRILDFGEHTLSATATGENFIESEKSNSIIANKYIVDTVLENLTSDAPTHTWYGDSLEIQLTASEGYGVPNTITATMGGLEEGIEYKGGTITIKNVSGDVSINAVGMLPGLASDSWETVVARTKDGSYTDYYTVGEEKAVDLTLEDGSTITVDMVLVGINADYEDYEMKKPIPLTFISKQLLPVGKMTWENAKTYVADTLPALLPTVLQENITIASKQHIEKGYSSFTYKPCWMPNGKEMGCTYNGTSNCNTSPVYSVFASNEDRIKCILGTTSTQHYWLRDNSYSYVDYAHYMTWSGTSGMKSKTDTYMICFGFCI